MLHVSLNDFHTISTTILKFLDEQRSYSYTHIRGAFSPKFLVNNMHTPSDRFVALVADKAYHVLQVGEIFYFCF